MGLFGFGKKKEVKNTRVVSTSCGCGSGSCASQGIPNGKEGEVGIKVLGSGCDKCNALEKNTRQALDKLGSAEKIDHVTDFGVIGSYGVMTTPALVVDGQVVSTGTVLKADDIAKKIQEVRG